MRLADTCNAGAWDEDVSLSQRCHLLFRCRSKLNLWMEETQLLLQSSWLPLPQLNYSTTR